jgi:hypothetical protein
MVGIEAPSRDAVDAAYVAALAGGGADEGAPGPRPHSFAPDYYGAYVRDLEGNKLHFGILPPRAAWSDPLSTLSW